MPFDLREIVLNSQGRELSLLSEYINPQMAKVLKTLGFDPVYVRGVGAHLWDDKGNDYLDMIAGFGVFALGRSHPRVKEAIRQYLDLDSPNLVKMGTQLFAGLLAEKLVEQFAPPGLDTVFFCNSGAEAVDGALKFAHAYTGRKRFIYCDHGYHGLTLGTLAVNGCKEFRTDYEAILNNGGSEVPFGDIGRLESELSQRDVAAFVVEPVIGHGVFIPPDDFLPRAREICSRYGTLFIADEVQTGFGRTGKLFGCDHWNVVPDIMTLSKSLSGGYCPIGAILYPRKVYKKVFSSMDRCMVHSSTFSQNDLAAVCGLVTLDVVREGLIENSALTGAYLMDRLRELATKYELIREVRGRGLMIAIEFGEPRSLSLKTGWKMIHGINRDLFCQAILVPLLMDHHILAQVSGHGRDIIKLIPPLVFDRNDADRFIGAFDSVLAAAHRFPGPVWEVGSRIAKAALR